MPVSCLVVHAMAGLSQPPACGGPRRSLHVGRVRLLCQTRQPSVQAANVQACLHPAAAGHAGGRSAMWRRRPCRRAAAATTCSVPLTDLEHTLTTLGKEQPHPQGRLLLRAVAEQDVKPATVLLTRAFATTGYLPLDDAGQYCSDMLKQPPQGILLVARLFPNDPELLPEGQDSRLVGTVALSFSRNTREEFPSLQPPDDGAYLSNMAVCPSFRRQGIARRLLAACEELCAARGFRRIYLHARLGDEPAIQLYSSFGYQEEVADSFLVKLRGITPRSLMFKDVAPAAVPAPAVPQH